METKEYIVLYTHQKTKKSKKWQDGKLKITQNGRIELFDDSNNKVETVYVKAGQIQVGEEVESDRHLITIEEVCNKSCDVNRLNQDSITQIPEKTNERIQPVCRQPLRKRRMGFTVPRQLNQHTVSADNDVETSVQYSQNSEGSLNYESKLPQFLETRASLLSSPLFSSKPHQRLSCKVVHQDSNPYKHKLSNVEHDNLQTNSGDDALQRNACHDQPQSNVDHGPLNGNHSQGHLQRNVGHDPLQRNSNCNPLQRSTSHNPLGRNTCHDILNVTDDRSGQGQFQGNIVRYKQCGNINEVRNPGVKDEVTERENGRDGHTGGKRSASQILALLGKKKNLSQPPLKRTRLDSGLVVRQSDSEGEAECFAKLDSYPAQSDTLEEENDLNRGRTKEQEEYSRTEDGGKHNSQQQEQRVTGMFENCNLHTSPSVLCKPTMLSSPKYIETKECLQKDCPKEENASTSAETFHEVNYVKYVNFEGSQVTAVDENGNLKDEGVCGKSCSEGCLETINVSRKPLSSVFKELSSPTKFSASYGKVCIHRTERGDRCGDIEVTVEAKNWTGKYVGENISKDIVSCMKGRSEVKENYASICDVGGKPSSEAIKESSNVEIVESVHSMTDGIPQELICFDLFMEEDTQARGSSEEGGLLDESITGGRSQPLERKDKMDGLIAPSNGHSLSSGEAEGLARETNGWTEGAIMEDLGNTCITKGRDQFVNEITLRDEQSTFSDGMEGSKTRVSSEEGIVKTVTVEGCSIKEGDQHVGRKDEKDGVTALINGHSLSSGEGGRHPSEKNRWSEGDVTDEIGDGCVKRGRDQFVDEVIFRDEQYVSSGGREGPGNEKRVLAEGEIVRMVTVEGCSAKEGDQSVGRRDSRDDVNEKGQAISFNAMKHHTNEKRVRNEGCGTNEVVEEVIIKEKDGFEGRKTSVGDGTGVGIGQSISLDLSEQNDERTRVRNEGCSANETLEDCSTKEKDQFWGRKILRDNFSAGIGHSITFDMSGQHGEGMRARVEGCRAIEAVEECNTKQCHQSVGGEGSIDDVMAFGMRESIPANVAKEGSTNGTKVRNEDGTGTNKTMEECNTKAHCLMKDVRDNIINIRNGPAARLDEIEENADNKGIRSEEKVKDTTDECSIKGREQCTESKYEEKDDGYVVIGPGSGQLVCWYQDDLKNGFVEVEEERLNLSCLDASAVDEIPGKISAVTDTSHNIQDGRNAIANTVPGDSASSKRNAGIEDQVKVSDANGITIGNNVSCLDAKGNKVSITGDGQKDGFMGDSDGDWCNDALTSSLETCSPISTTRETNFIGKKVCKSPTSEAESGNYILQNSNDNTNTLEVVHGQDCESLPSIFVTQRSTDDEEGDDLLICVSSQEKDNLDSLLEQSEILSQSHGGHTTSNFSESSTQHERDLDQLLFSKNCKKTPKCNMDDSSEVTVAISCEDGIKHGDMITTGAQCKSNSKSEKLEDAIVKTTKHGRVPSLEARSSFSEGCEESPSEGININSQNSLLSITTTDTLDSSFTCSQESLSGLKAVQEGMKSRTGELVSRNMTPCEPGKDELFLSHEGRDILSHMDCVTNSTTNVDLNRCEMVEEFEKSLEHDVLDMLQACLHRRDSPKMQENTTLNHYPVLNDRNQNSHCDGVTQCTEAQGYIPCRTITTEASVPASAKPSLITDFGGRSGLSDENIKYIDPKPSQLVTRCDVNGVGGTFSEKKEDGADFSNHQLKQELGSSSAQKKATRSFPESSSNFHLHRKSQSHYWYQPLASNVVRRRPPSPTVTFASTCRAEFPTSEFQLHSGRNDKVLQFLRQREDDGVMLHPDYLNPEEYFLKFEMGNQSDVRGRALENAVRTSLVPGDNVNQRGEEKQWMPELHGRNIEESLLDHPGVHDYVGNQLKEKMNLANGRNVSFCMNVDADDKDDHEAGTTGMAVHPRNALPDTQSAFIGSSCDSDGKGLTALQSHEDLLQELDKDSYSVPTIGDMRAAHGVDFFHPESLVFPLFADIKGMCRSDNLSNSSPFQQVPSSSQEYLSSPVASRKFFCRDENSVKEKEPGTYYSDEIVTDLPSCGMVFHKMFASETSHPQQTPASKSFLSCRQDHLINEYSSVVPQWSTEYLPQIETGHQMNLPDPQQLHESVIECNMQCASQSCDFEEPIRSDNENKLDNEKDFLEQEIDVPVLDTYSSQEFVAEIDSQMDLFISQPEATLDEDGQKEDAMRRDEDNQDKTTDGVQKVLYETLKSSSITPKGKCRKKPLVAIATEDYKSSPSFVKHDDATVPKVDNEACEYSQIMINLTGGGESDRCLESSIGTEPTVIQTDSIDVSENEMEKPAPPSNTHYKPFPQKQSGHMTGRRRPLHQMQPPFQSPSSYLPVSSQTGKFQAPTLKKQHLTSGSVCPQKNLSDDLMFPSLEDATSAVIPQRQVRIPTIFQDAATYKLVLTAVLKEHLNIILFQVAHDFFTALSKVDVSTYSSTKGITKGVDTQNPPCQHKQPSKKVCVKKDGPNKGRFFFTCSNTRGNQCKFFQWADHKTQRSSKGQPNRSEREALSDAKSIEMYMKSFGVSLYCECQLLRKSPFPDSIPGAPAWIKKYRQQKLNNERKKLYLRLSRKEGSSVYGKDDLWVISKDLRFDSNQSFLAKSVFHGPNSSSELEIEPLGGYSPSNWPNEAIVHAIHAYNASTELTCLDNIKEFVNQRTLPILPALLKRNHSSQPVIQSHTTFKSPAIASSMGRTLHCSDDQIRHLADSIVCKYSLNEDQAQALRGVAEMLTSDDANVPPVTLIHGVFGAGKSYLLAVTVLFLTQLFQLHQDGGGDPNDWKVLISSTTNVAVDRILLSLLELGFEDFIRVGSMRKIAKPVLPYSVHASDKSNQELKELQEMLRGDLSPAEKNFVRKSIERQRLGLNKKMLSKVLVVGVTCAACTFPCIHNLKFPVVLLDECSQITEPACLLPVARFECQKLVLVGDPKQLDPTIQGSEPTHDTSLEQTLFDRLLLMGYQPTLLRTQYRCHPRISAIANELFYENKLLDGVTEGQRGKLAEGFPTLCFFNVANGKECCTTGGSYLNDKEGAFVVTMIEMLVGTGVEPSQIGVITLYKAQVAHVTVLLQQSRLGNMKEIKAIQISTVDAFQGGEKDIIILSCVRTDFMGFAASDKRTNVALTRSRNHLLIVGNQRILSANSLWKRVMAKCRECPKGIQDSAAVLKKWTPKLAEIRLDAEKEKKQAKSKKSKKICDTQSTVLSIQSEHASSPPLSLGSTVDEEDQSVPEVISVSTPGKSFQEHPTDFKKFDFVTELSQENHMQDDVFCADQFASFSHNPDEHCPQQVKCGQADNFAVEGSAFEVFQSNVHPENKGNISEVVSGNKLTVNEKSHQNLGEVSNVREAADEECKPGEMTLDYREAVMVSGNKDMLEVSLNESPSYSPLGDDALVDSGDSDEELPNFDFDMDV